jgi:hypothetical protein
MYEYSGSYPSMENKQTSNLSTKQRKECKCMLKRDGLKGQWREIVYGPNLSLWAGTERSYKHFAFGPKVREVGPNLTHLALEENALNVLNRLLLQR